MQALAMHSDEKLQCALTLGQQMCITLHPNSSVKMGFFSIRVWICVWFSYSCTPRCVDSL